MVQQDHRGSDRTPGHEDWDARDSRRWIAFEASEKFIKWQLGFGKTLADNFTTSFPSGHEGENGSSDEQGKPAAVCELEDVGSKETEVDDQQPESDEADYP